MRTTAYTFSAVLIIAMLSGCGSPSAKKEHVPDQLSIDTVALKSVKGMREDLFILWSAIKEMHPGYGIYTTADSLRRAYEKTYSAIQTPLTESRFITLIYPFLCNLGCGHTQIRHSEGYKPPNNIKVPHLPFEVLVRNHRAWVTTHQTAQLNTGDEIISINGIPVATVIAHGYGLYCGDGYNETFKELYLGEYDGLEDVCNNFYHWPGPYQLKFRTGIGEVKSVLINEAKSGAPDKPPLKEIDDHAKWTIAESIAGSRLRFLNHASVALLKSPPFAYTDTLVFREAFKLIRQEGIKTLILDMRHNSGGDLRIATQLLSYLADYPFKIVKDVKARLPNPAINSFAKYFDTSSTADFLMGFKPTYKEGSWYHIEGRPAFGNLYGPFPLDKADHFNGKLLVLIDGATFSSGALFSAAVKAQRKGVVFIGRQTAGAEEGCNGVTVQRLTLPNTKIVVDFPWMRVVSMAKRIAIGRGIIPDYTIDYSPEDVMAQNDLDLKKALSISNY